MFKEMEGVRVEDDVRIQGRVSAVCHVFSVADSEEKAGSAVFPWALLGFG